MCGISKKPIENKSEMYNFLRYLYKPKLKRLRSKNNRTVG